MKVDSNDPRPPYVQIAEALRDAIRAGTLTPGQKLPSGRELADEYGVAVMTAQRAVGELRSEGLLRSYSNRGVFVTAPGHEEPQEEVDLRALRDEVRELTQRLARLEQRLDGS